MPAWLDRVEVLLRAPQAVASDPGQRPRRRWLLGATATLGGTYGAFMGAYALRTNGWDGLLQLLSTTLKLPALLLLTLAVTLPSLCVFGALANSRLRFADTTRLLLGTTAVSAIVAASFGPILGFFTISTTSYPFMVLLNVVLLAVAGCVGCAALLRGLRAWSARDTIATEPTPEAPPVQPDALAPRRTDPAFTLMGVWIILYGVVGAQMGWVLRPFIGSPDLPFALFRPTEGSVFPAIWRTLWSVFGG
ncbi:MAG: hypothetical protein R3B49_04300 [Phycisphaerales bacterium]